MQERFPESLQHDLTDFCQAAPQKGELKPATSLSVGLKRSDNFVQLSLYSIICHDYILKKINGSLQA